MKSKKPRFPRYPVTRYVREYAAWHLTLYGKRKTDWAMKELRRFFLRFEGYAGLEQFTIAEVTEYIQWRLRNGTHHARLAIELYAVHRFWRYLSETRNLPLVAPIRQNTLRDLQTGKTRVTKPEGESNPFADIKFASPNEWSPIPDCYDYLTMCGWIDKNENGPER